MVLNRDNCVSLMDLIMHIKTQFHHTSFTRYVHHIIQTQQHTLVCQRVLNIIQCNNKLFSQFCDDASIIHPGQSKLFCAFIFKCQLLSDNEQSLKKKFKVRCPLFVEVQCVFLSVLTLLFVFACGQSSKGLGF